MTQSFMPYHSIVYNIEHSIYINSSINATLHKTWYIQLLSENIETTAKNDVAAVATSNVKLFSKTIW